MVDFRELNQLTSLESFPLLVISDFFNSLNEVKYFSAVDLLNAYRQVPLEEKSRKKTAFTCSEDSLNFAKRHSDLPMLQCIFVRSYMAF